MAQIRNKLKDFHGILNSDYVLLIDADVILLPNTIEKILDSFNKDIAMVTTYCICYESLPNCHYFDTFALITNNLISYKESSNTCLFKNCKRCIKYRNDNLIKVNNEDLYDENLENIEVESKLSEQ